MKLPEIPKKSILGINYSGMHDSAIAIITPEGKPIFAVSLERLSRIKQDGRTLTTMFEYIPWDRIDKVAISAPKSLDFTESYDSKLLNTRLPQQRKPSTLAHGHGFYDALRNIPCEKFHIGHQESHAALAFWSSGFEEALCLTYDGGMSNDIWFGGLYSCHKSNGIKPLDRFDALRYAKITTLYTFVTALLGFMPIRHEGKITGLAAYGKPTKRCTSLLEQWFENEYTDIEETLYWINCYKETAVPQLIPSPAKLSRYHTALQDISKEELAASVQNFSESHIIEIIEKAKSLGWYMPHICLAGGLFANVKINQKIAETGFNKLFVAPPMTDDGTALGAAWYLAAQSDTFRPQALSNIAFLGPAFPSEVVLGLTKREGIHYSMPANPDYAIAELLATGHIVAVFQGASEFGPRALGNRSILAQATKYEINHSLNKRLNRTEFMPFAPMTREEDADLCYFDIERVMHAAQFMTVTVNCRDVMKKSCPAVVHVDGTARPQIVTRQQHPLIHKIITAYKDITGIPSIINTSFNVHEEPIVCSPEDALRGFFESALDYLYMEGIGLISYQDNKDIAIRYLQAKNQRKSQKEILHESLISFLDSALAERTLWLEQNGFDLKNRTAELVKTRSILKARTELLEQVSQELVSRTEELVATRAILKERTELLEQLSAFHKA